MTQPKLGKLELKIMEAFWDKGAITVREVQERFPLKGRPAYTTIQTMVNRLETKGALRRTDKAGKAFVFEALISRSAAQGRLVDDFLGLFGGRMQPLMAHLVDSGKLTLGDVEAAEKRLRELARKRKAK